MKRIFLTIVLLVSISFASWSQERSFMQLKDMPGVELINFNKEALKALYEAADSTTKDDTKLEDIDSFYLLSIDKIGYDKKERRKLRRTIKKAHSVLNNLNNDGFEQIIVDVEDDEDKDDDKEEVTIFQRKINHEKSEFIIYSENEDDIIIFTVTGKLGTKEAKDLISIKIG